MASLQPQPYTMNYDMTRRTQDPEYLMKVNEQAVDTFYEPDCIDMEKSNRGMEDALMGNVAPDTLAAINAQDVKIDEFDINKIDFESLNTDIFPLLGLNGLLQEQLVNQQQPQPWLQEGRNPYSHVGFVQTDLSTNARLQDARFAALTGTLQPKQQSPQHYIEPQAPQGVLQQPYASPRPVQQSHVQTQAPWVKQESPSHGQRMQGIKQQRMAAHQSITSHLTVPIPTERQGELQYPIPAHGTAPQPQLPVFAQVPAQASRLIAAAAPQTMQIANFAEAQQAAATRAIRHNYIPPANDNSFLEDQAARKSYIRQLYDAFTDTTQCIDRATVPNFSSHWATLSSNPSTSPITPSQITTICHALLSIAIDLHTRGPISLNVFDQAKLKNVYKYRNLRFSERIAKVCELMRMSKARCGSLLKFDGLEMVVATAPLLCRQTGSNYHHNRERQDNLVEGNLVEKKKRKAGKMDEDESGDEEEGGEWE